MNKIRMVNLKEENLVPNELLHLFLSGEFKTAYVQLEECVELAYKDRFQEAIRKLIPIVQEFPTAFFLNFYLGILYFNIGDYSKAISSFQKELENYPMFTETAWEMASAYSRLGLSDEAIGMYSYALNIDPLCVPALFGMGNACFRNEEYENSVEYYEDLLFLKPEFYRTDIRQALLFDEKFIANVHSNIGYALVKMDRIDEAVYHFNKAIEMFPNTELSNRCKLLLGLIENGKYKEVNFVIKYVEGGYE